MKRNIKLIFSVLFIVILASCKKESELNNDGRGSLVDYQFISTITAEAVVNNFPEQADYAEQIDTIAKYPISIYRYTYNSIYKNQPIVLSGLIMVPVTNQPLPIFTYLHGTMKPYPFPEGEGSEDIPSIYNGAYPDASWKQGETRLFGSFTASHGYITVLPDYAGYGASANVSHPYTIHRELAKESIDAILAAQEFLMKENINTNKKVFLSGWSEGAGAALAAHKEIESFYSHKIHLVASANFAGPYNMEEMGELMVLLPAATIELDPSALNSILWSLYAHNLFAENPLPNDSIFKINVTSELSVLRDRTSNIPSEIVKESFIGSEFMKNEFVKNDLIIGWNPVRKVFFYYGSEDTDVYPFNSVNAYNAFINRGSDVELIEYVGDDHETPVLKYYLSMMAKFDQLNN
jgi:hypothetical protein